MNTTQTQNETTQHRTTKTNSNTNTNANTKQNNAKQYSTIQNKTTQARKNEKGPRPERLGERKAPPFGGSRVNRGAEAQQHVERQQGGDAEEARQETPEVRLSTREVRGLGSTLSTWPNRKLRL